MKIVGWMSVLGAVGLSVGLSGPVRAQMQAPPGSAAVGGNAVSDADITANIQGKLEQIRLLRQAQVTVVTKDGTVTLVGTIPSEFARAEAMDAVRSTPGVLRTNDQLRVAIQSPQAPSRN